MYLQLRGQREVLAYSIVCSFFIIEHFLYQTIRDKLISMKKDQLVTERMLRFVDELKC